MGSLHGQLVREAGFRLPERRLKRMREETGGAESAWGET
jgi:hypothetical protein